MNFPIGSGSCFVIGNTSTGIQPWLKQQILSWYVMSGVFQPGTLNPEPSNLFSIIHTQICNILQPVRF